MPKQKLVIAEKPSVGMALAKVLGARGKRKGYMIGGGYIVSWCVGHLAGLADAAVYDPSYAKWRWNDLPIIPESCPHSPPHTPLHMFIHTCVYTSKTIPSMDL